MGKSEALRFWIDSAEEHIRVARDLYTLSHYHWSLFMWHLAIEKVLKGLLIERDIRLQYTHDLVNLARTAKLNLEPKQIEQLNEITTFNLEARYDDYKRAFYKKADKAYTEKWTKIAEELYLWIKQHIH